MLISLGDAPIHAYQCVQKIKLIFLETTYFLVWSVRLEFFSPPNCICLVLDLSVLHVGKGWGIRRWVKEMSWGWDNKGGATADAILRKLLTSTKSTSNLHYTLPGAERGPRHIPHESREEDCSISTMMGIVKVGKSAGIPRKSGFRTFF
jgi:hypothetical protein